MINTEAKVALGSEGAKGLAASIGGTVNTSGQQTSGDKLLVGYEVALIR